MAVTVVQGTLRVMAATLAAAAAVACALAPSASASPFDPTGALRIVRHAHAELNANQSSNWFGYNAGALERNGAQFHSITSDWTVPAASQHARGQSESSATWIGIGGGCLDAGCGLNDVTLIQAGTEQDVDSPGHASYSAWWELVPAPAVTIGHMAVSPGDHIHASVAEGSPNSEIWTITLKDVTRNENFSTTVPYPSTHSTAEWIEETPLTIGTGEASLPALTPAQFDNATLNGASPQLKPAEQLQLSDSSNKVIATPSAPDAEADGFAACAWSSSCATPASSQTAAHRRAHHRRHRRHHRRSHHRHHQRHRHRPAR
jgi:hypothetical protein